MEQSYINSNCGINIYVRIEDQIWGSNGFSSCVWPITEDLFITLHHENQMQATDDECFHKFPYHICT